MKELHGLVGPDGDISDDLEYNSQYALPGFDIASVFDGSVANTVDVQSVNHLRSVDSYPVSQRQ